MKMYEIVELANLYDRIKDYKMPLKTSYKFSILMRQVEREMRFYQEEFAKIIQAYGKYENGKLVYSEDGEAIIIIPGKEQECNSKIVELKNLEVDIKDVDFTFSEIECLDNLEFTVSEMACLLPLIKI